MAADVGAAVASVIDSARPSPNGAAPESSRRGPGRPPVDPSHLSMTPEAVRARRRRDQARGNGGDRPAPAPSPKYSPSARPAPAVQPPPPPPTASPADLSRATGFIKRLTQGAGMIAAKIFGDDRMKVPEAEAQETADLIIDAWPELAILDADGKKWLAALYVGSLVAERYGQYQRRTPANPNRPAGEPVAVVDKPRSSLGEVPILG